MLQNIVVVVRNDYKDSDCLVSLLSDSPRSDGMRDAVPLKILVRLV